MPRASKGLFEVIRGEERNVRTELMIDQPVPPLSGVPLAEQYTTHYLRLVRLASQLVDDQESAEDVVQEVFARLHATLSVEQPRNVLGYLRSAVVNEARSTLRRRRVRRRWTTWQNVELSPPADEATLRADQSTNMLHLVDRLPRRQREVVVLKYYEDLTTAEIAGVLGITASAVTSSLGRALTTLKATLGDDHDH